MTVPRAPTKALSTWLLLAALLGPLTALAQQPPRTLAWDARAIATGGADDVVLHVRDGSTAQEVARLPRERIAGLVAMTDRLSAALQIQAPAIRLTTRADESPNASATFRDGQPLIAVNLAMLRLAGDDEAMLAGVVGHELGHLKANHPRDGHSRAAVVTLIGALIGAAVDLSQARRGRDTGGAATLLGGLGAGLANAKFSRDQEREADELGIQAMAKAGYDPEGAARIWRELTRVSRFASTGVWLDTHPSHPEREQTLGALATQLQPVYLAAARPGGASTSGAAPTAPVDDPYPRSAYTSFAPSPQERAAGSAYVRGHDAMLQRDYPQAEPALQEAARAGDERALTMLADLQAGAMPGRQDPAAAMQLLQQAAAQGFGPALRRLAVAALTGAGRPMDPAEGIRLLGFAADRADPRAQAMLGFHYASAQHVVRDFVRARALAQASADGGDALGKALLGKMMRDGDGGPADPARGFALLQEAAGAEAEMAWAQYQLGLSHERGLGTAVDRERALSHYDEAAAAGVVAADDRAKALRGR